MDPPNEDDVYAITLGCPTGARLELDVGLDAGAEVTLADQPGTLSWSSTDQGVRIELPEAPDEQPAVAVRLSPRSAVRSG